MKIAIKSEAHWHELRAKNVGSSDIAALFNVSPWVTLFTLWHQKAGNLPHDFKKTEERMSWGNRLESVIAEGLAADHGLKIEKNDHYWKHDTVEGLGGTPDYFILTDDGPAVFEIKNVSWFSWRDGWLNDDDQIEPPVDYELQMQHQLSITGMDKGFFGVLVGGSEPHLIERPRHNKAIAAIEKKTAEFWQSIKEGKEPEVFNESDYAAVLALCGKKMKPRQDMTGHAMLPSLCETFLFHQARKNESEKAYKEAKTKIMAIVREYEYTVCQPFNIKQKSNRLTVKSMEEIK